MKPGETCKLKIEDLTEEGQGVAKENGLVVFVSPQDSTSCASEKSSSCVSRDSASCTLGDEVEVKITKIKNNLAFGKVVKIITSSMARRKPEEICPVIDSCGGCPFGHLKYERQLTLKEKQVKDKLTRIGKIKDPKIKPIIPAVTLAHYRNKATLHVEPQEDGPAKVGFYKPKSHEIVNVKGCKIAPIDMDEVIEFAKQNVGVKCDLIIKEAKGTDEEMIVSSCQGAKLEVIAGPGTITDVMEIAGHQMQFEISPQAFYQVNPEQTKKLYEKVLEYLDLEGHERILDLYCGVGTIGLVCAKELAAKSASPGAAQAQGPAAGAVLGIESSKDAVLDANRNAVINRIVNATYICGKAEDKLDEIEEFGPDAVIVDPPRSGCHPKLLETICQVGPKKICYVSCNPATLARDVKFLQERGFKLNEVTPVDMFPETGHVECVALMSKAKS